MKVLCRSWLFVAKALTGVSSQIMLAIALLILIFHYFKKALLKGLMGSVSRFIAIVCLPLVLAESAYSSDPEQVPEGSPTKICLEISAPETAAEAVEAQIKSQFDKISYVALVLDPDEADHILRFEVHELRLKSDLLTGYAIVVIWKMRKPLREIEKIFGRDWSEEERNDFRRMISGSTLYGTEAFYTCGRDELKQRLSTVISEIDNKVLRSLSSR